MEGDLVFLVPIVVVPTALLFVLAIGPFRKPLANWLNRKADGGASTELREEILEQRERLEEAEGRIVELEERLDFTERLLTRGKETGSPES